MKTYKAKGIIDKNHPLSLNILCNMNAEEVEVILLPPQQNLWVAFLRITYNHLILKCFLLFNSENFFDSKKLRLIKPPEH